MKASREIIFRKRNFTEENLENSRKLLYIQYLQFWKLLRVLDIGKKIGWIHARYTW
jgi:hypothetical protein